MQKKKKSSNIKVSYKVSQGIDTINNCDLSDPNYQTYFWHTRNSMYFSENASKVMIELLGSYTESTASQARDDAQRCIISAIAAPNTYLMDHLLTLKPVKQLEGEKIYEVSE